MAPNARERGPERQIDFPSAARPPGDAERPCCAWRAELATSPRSRADAARRASDTRPTSRIDAGRAPDWAPMRPFGSARAPQARARAEIQTARGADWGWRRDPRATGPQGDGIAGGWGGTGRTLGPRSGRGFQRRRNPQRGAEMQASSVQATRQTRIFRSTKVPPPLAFSHAFDSTASFSTASHPLRER